MHVHAAHHGRPEIGMFFWVATGHAFTMVCGTSTRMSAWTNMFLRGSGRGMLWRRGHRTFRAFIMTFGRPASGFSDI